MNVYCTFNTVGGRWKFRSTGELAMYRIDALLSEPITVVSFNGMPAIPLDDGTCDVATMWYEEPGGLKQPVTTCTSVGGVYKSTDAPTVQGVAGKASAWCTQVGGGHYKDMRIQPLEFSMANKLDPMQHTIIKYVTRFRAKNGMQDLEKARHALDLLIEWEKSNATDQH